MRILFPGYTSQAGATTCYPSMTDQRLYEVYSHPLAFAGAGSQ